MNKLPPGGLLARRAIFFRQEISIQDEIWLGGGNILGLTTQTEGVLAHYTLDGVDALLLMVQYPDADAASTGLTALNGAKISDLLIAGTSNTLLAAIFSTYPAAAALLADALK